MNYKIEDGIDFNACLMEAICIDSDSDEEDNDNKCLISDMPLNKIHITLSCGHKFNYMPLYYDVVQQKSFKNRGVEIVHLSQNQFKCPYCRKIQNQLLPYLPDESDQILKLKGVNAPDRATMKLNKCPHVFKSGKRKGQTCNCPTNDKYCKAHSKLQCNMVVSETNNTGSKEPVKSCSAIIKSGPRKGQQCGCMKIHFNPHDNNYYCKRHYNMISQ